MLRTRLITFCCGFLFCLLSISAPTHAESCQDDVSHLFCELLENDETYERYSYSSYRKLIYGKDGWIFRTASDLKTDFSLPDETLVHLRRLNDAFAAKDIRLIMLYLPTRGLLHSEYLLPEDKRLYRFSYPGAAWKSYEDSIKSMRSVGLHVVGLPRPKPGTPFFYKRDHHWSAAGAKQTAEVLASYIKKLPEYRETRKVKFKTTEGERYAFYGVSKKIFKKLCDTIQPPEMIYKMITEREDVAAANDDLFGDTIDPDIVLMGTSNSTQEPAFANFEGFLKEALSADILNKSVSGGGLDTAVITYLSSDDYKNKPAKIAIWEVPSYYDMAAQPSFFREAVPAVYGDCGIDSIVSKSAIPVTERGIIAFSDLANSRISGGDYYIHIRFSKPIAESFFLGLHYNKGHEKYKFRRLARFQADGQFFLSLNNPRTLNKVVLTLPNKMPGETVDVKICKTPGTVLAKK
jgi:alginate biosynthesis protein AlgX